MTGRGRTTSARCPEVPVLARELAARLSALFERDVSIVERLNDAQRRLTCASERLWSGLAPDAFGLVYDGAAPAGQSHIAALVGSTRGLVGPDAETAVLGALQQTHWSIRRAFHDYQDACEERRQLAVEVGEVSQQLTCVLCAAGWSAEDAQAVDVHELACTSSGARGRDEALDGRRCRSAGRKEVPVWCESWPRRIKYRMTGDLSQLTERQLYALRERLAAGVHDPTLTLRGAVHSHVRWCSKVSCRCRSGELHGP